VHQILLCAQVPFGRLNGSVSQKQLDLLQLPAGRPAQLRAGASKVMGCDSWNAGRRRIPLEQLPDHLFAQTDALRLAAAIHRTEHESTITPDASGGYRRQEIPV
jgi:hypothetical protein